MPKGMCRDGRYVSRVYLARGEAVNQPDFNGSKNLSAEDRRTLFTIGCVCALAFILGVVLFIVNFPTLVGP
jgi:hypothetical protein